MISLVLYNSLKGKNMYSFLLATIIAAGVFFSPAVSIFQKDNKIRENITRSKQLQTVQKLSTIDNIKKIKLSNLVQDTNLTLQEKEDLNNFQKAVNKAVIEDNKNNPSCSDLVATGYISEAKCKNYKNASNNYATVKKGKLSLSNPKMIQIINAKDPFKDSVTNDNNGVTQIQSYNKEFLQKHLIENIRLSKKERIEARIISTTTDLDKLKEYEDIFRKRLQDIEESSNNSQVYRNKKMKFLNKLLNIARRKQQIQNNINFHL